MTRFLTITALSVLAMSSQANACACAGGATKAEVLKDVNTRESSIITSRDGTHLKATFWGTEEAPVAAAPAKAAPAKAAPAPVTVSSDTETVKSYRLEFATNATTPTSVEQLPEIKKALASGEYKSVKIVGYADETGTVNYNNKLALSRAQEVQKLMKSSANKNTKVSALGGGVKEGNLEEARVVEIQLVK